MCGFDTALCLLMVYSHKIYYFLLKSFCCEHAYEPIFKWHMYIVCIRRCRCHYNAKYGTIVHDHILYTVYNWSIYFKTRLSNIWNIKHIFKMCTCINDCNISFLISLIRDCLLNNDTSQYIVRKLASIALLTLFWNVAVNWQGKVIKQ